jgi:hypothetical protein
LGILSNDKPSAIFKLGGMKSQARSLDVLMDDSVGAFEATKGTVAQLGISIEPLEEVQRQADAASSTSMAVVKPVNQQELSVKLIESNKG